MEPNVNYTIVGIFVITLITFIVLSIIWLSSGFSFQTYKNYLVYMQESVNGLNVDSPVEFNGVNVGTVKSITIDHNNPQVVKVVLNIKSDTPVTQGTDATLNTKGITGVAYVALKDSSTDLTPLTKRDDQEFPVIKTSPSLFLRMDAALKKLNDSFERISASIQTLLDPENQGNIKKILKQLEQFTNALAKNSEHFNSIIGNTSRASAQFYPTMQNINMQTLPAADHFISNLDQMSNDLKQNPSILLRGTEQQPLGPGEK